MFFITGSPIPGLGSFRRMVTGILILLFLLLSIALSGQSWSADRATQHLKEQQQSLLRFLQYVSIDSNILNGLTTFIQTDMDSICNSVMNDTTVSDDKKILALQSMSSFINEIGQNIYLDKFNIYDLPATLESYKTILKSIIYHLPFEDVLKSLSVVPTQILARSFWNYDTHVLLDDIAVYKDVASSPASILQFLEREPGFRFTDSLLCVAAANDPMKMSSYLLVDSPGLRDHIRTSKNIYLQEIVSVSGNRNASELLPMLIPLAEKRITEKEILKKRSEVTPYFQLLIDALLNELTRAQDSSFVFRAGLRNAIKEKSVYFYVQWINDRHAERESIRFASVKDLRLEDLYYVITSCEDELYTSSYLGLYHRLMEYFRSKPGDSLFKLVHYDNFHIFMRMAANYNTLADFLSCMPGESSAELLRRFISGIEDDTGSGLEKAMDIADSYTDLTHHIFISELIEKELISNLARCESGQLYYGTRLYGILLQVFCLLKEGDTLNDLRTYLGNHEILRRKALQDGRNEIVELVLFYGDEDGMASYNNFINLFNDEKKWEISKKEYWVTIRSLSGQRIIIYANLPLDSKAGLDFIAQDSLSKFLKSQSISPSILVHRGHSYHLSKSLMRLEPSVKLAILGSCGGYNSILGVSNISPEAQVIVSKKTGSKFINDPLIDVINDLLRNKKDLVWTEVWEKLTIRLGKDQFALSLFSDYLPPTKNVSFFVLKLFNSYRWQ